MMLIRRFWAWWCDLELARLVSRADLWSDRRDAAVRAQVRSEQARRRRRVARRFR